MSWTWGIFMGLGSKAHTDCLIVLRALGVSRAVRGGGADMAALEGVWVHVWAIRCASAPLGALYGMNWCGLVWFKMCPSMRVSCVSV